MMPYILHVTVITTVCFLFYKFLLQKETFYRLNRWMLMGCLAVSFLLPLLPVPRDWSWREALMSKAAPTIAVKMHSVTDVLRPDVSPEQVPASPVLSNEGGGTLGKKATMPIARERKPIGSAKAVAEMKLNGDGKPGAGEKRDGEGKPDGKEMHDRDGNRPVGMQAVQGNPGLFAGTPVNVAGREGVGGWDAVWNAVWLAMQWLSWLYLFGLLVFGANFLLQMAVLLYQSYRRPVLREGAFRIVETSGNRAPCSFGNTIFINPGNYDRDTYNQILIHEKVHVSGRHTLDILMAEIAVVLQWFNPFAWLYRREVENNLEFLTDASVLEHRGVERYAYQLSLLRVSAPHLPFSITNNYNQSLLKRRIVMMNSKKSSSHTVWKYFFLIPLLTGLVCALNKPEAFGAGRKELSTNANAGGASINAGSAATSGADAKAGGGNGRGNGDDKRVVAAGAIPDTGKKPGIDSSRLPHYNLHENAKKPELPELAGSDERAVQLMYMDQAMRNLKEAGKIAGKDNLELDQELAKAKLAQLDMLGQENTLGGQNMQLEKELMVSKALANARALPRMGDINVGDMRIAGDTDVLEGSWFATSFVSDEKLRFELKRESENGSWNNSFSVEKSEFKPYPGQGNVEFSLTRDAGTVVFKGQFDGQEGFGHFRFLPDEGYFKAMKQMGLEDLDGRRFAFFTVNIKKDYATMLVQAFPHLNTHELISCAATRLEASDIKYWQGAGITGLDEPRTLITLKSMQVDRAYVDELKAAGFDHLTVHELISLKSQHVTGAFIKDFRAIGYNDLSPRDLISLKAMGITPEYVKGFRDIGYKDADVRQLHSFKSMGITPEYIKGWRDIGYDDMRPQQMMSLKSMGVTPEFVREFNKIGFDHIPVNMLGLLKSTGVNAEWVSKMQEKGFVSKDLGKYIRLKNDFN